jgi:hypothetical protein
MIRTMNIEAIERGIGRSWTEVEEFLASIDAKDKSHKEIAQALQDAGLAKDWWAQSATVAFEQLIGRRVPGQDCDGRFQTSTSKTVAGTMDEARDKWVALIGAAEDFSGVGISRGPELSETAKWRYWRCGLADGSRVNVNIYEKAPGKSALSLQHEKLEAPEQLVHWKSFWKATLSQLS